jgi:uncharacterized damage-inducible protein DinB
MSDSVLTTPVKEHIMIELSEITRMLSANAQAMLALVGGIPDEQAEWKPDEKTWSMKQVMAHVYNEERMDFRKHLQEMLSDPPQPWDSIPMPWTPVASCHQALMDFLDERDASIAWLNGLKSPDWNTSQQVQFGENEILRMSAGEVLQSWPEHDILHLRQMIELHHAWNEKQAAPYLLRYAGGW